LKFRFVASVSSLASGSPVASTFCESADGTKAMLTGLLVEPFVSPVGIGGAFGLATAAATGLAAAAAAGDGLAAGDAAGDAAGLTAGDGEAAGEAAVDGDGAGDVAGLAGAVVGGAGAAVGCAAGAAAWHAAIAGTSSTRAVSMENARGARRCMFFTAPCESVWL
jgi:hypothetical protein